MTIRTTLDAAQDEALHGAVRDLVGLLVEHRNVWPSQAAMLVVYVAAGLSAEGNGYTTARLLRLMAAKIDGHVDDLGRQIDDALAALGAADIAVARLAATPAKGTA